MIGKRTGLLALCGVVFALTAFTATAAHAEVGANWLVLDSNGVLKTSLEASLVMETETIQIQHTKIAGISVLFECKKASGENTVISAGGTLTGKMKSSECITKLNGVTSAACEPKAEGKEKGVIKSNALHGVIELHELANGTKDDVLRVLPNSGETFATMEMGEECAIGEKVPTIGKLTLRDCQGLFLTHLVEHLFEIGPLTELWSISKTPEHLSTILGSAWARLGGAHAGLKFAGDPA